MAYLPPETAAEARRLHQPPAVCTRISDGFTFACWDSRELMLDFQRECVRLGKFGEYDIQTFRPTKLGNGDWDYRPRLKLKAIGHRGFRG